MTNSIVFDSCCCFSIDNHVSTASAITLKVYCCVRRTWIYLREHLEKKIHLGINACLFDSIKHWHACK